MERARDRRGGEREHVELEPERADQLLLRDAEALLLVEDHEPELLRDHVAAEDAVRADEDVHLARGEVAQHLLRLRGGAEARDHLDVDGEVAETRLERVPVLLGEDRRRAEDERLLAVDGDRERGSNRDLGLAEADVAADEPVHRPWRLEVFLHSFDRARLVFRLAIGKLGLEPLEPLVLQLVRVTRRLLALRVEADQLRRELAHRLAGARLQVRPRLAAELGERRRAGVGADVLRDLAELLVRDVEPILAAEADEEVVARDAGDLLRLEAEQLPDPVILVDDEVAGAQVGERGERATEAAVGTRGPLAEDLGVGQEHEPELAPDEAAARRRDREEELRLLGEVGAGLEHVSVGAAEQVLRPQGLAGVREGDDDAVAGADEPGELLLGLGEPARRERRPLGLEGERLRLRERVELGRALQADRVEPLLGPDAPHLLRLPDEVRHAVESEDEIGGDDRRRTLLGEERTAPWIDELGPPLRRRIDGRIGDRVQRPLGEGREDADLLDLVAEELDPQRLPTGGGKDVDDPAPHRELPALLGSLDPFVACERERLRQPFDTRLLPDLEPNRRRPVPRRRHPLGHCDRRRADETAPREHVERARPLPDEMRWRVQARKPTRRPVRAGAPRARRR